MEGILQRISSFSASHFRILRKEKAEEETERLKREAFLAEITDVCLTSKMLKSIYKKYISKYGIKWPRSFIVNPQNSEILKPV